MAIKYIDFSTAIAGSGTTISPYTFAQFVADVSATSVNDIYRVKGTTSTHTNIVITTSATIDITNWEGQDGINEPWSLYMLSGSSITCDADAASELLWIRNGRILFDDQGSTAPEIVAAGNRVPVFENMHLNFYGQTNFREFRELTFLNSTLITSAGTGEVLFYYSTNNEVAPYYKFHNSIIQDASFTHQYVVSPGVTGQLFEFDEVVTNVSAISANFVQGYGATQGVTITQTNVQNDWEVDTAIQVYEVSAITSTDTNYLTSTFNEITATGNPALGSVKTFDTVYSTTTRDGIGALYFPTLNPVLSADLSAGNIPLVTSFMTILSGNNTSASLYNYTFGDGATSSTTSADAVVHNYNVVGKYAPSTSASAFHNWYNISDSLDFQISAGTGDLSGNIIIIDVTTSAALTNAYINNAVAISSTYLSGSPTLYDVLWGDESSAADVLVSDNRIYQEHTYSIGGSYDVSAVIKNGVDTDVTLTTGILVVDEVSQRTFYVDINRSNDATSVNTGTSVDPFDYAEFIAKVAAGSDGVNYDTYKLRGFRELTATSEIIDVNTSAHYSIEAWDLSVYGPWMICKNDEYLKNYTMSFIGAHIIGGLYYNKTDLSDGSPLSLSHATNMYIVNQGTNSGIQAYAYETAISAAGSPATLTSAFEGIDIVGSTIYTDSGFKVGRTYTNSSVSALSANFNIIDSVITGMVDIDNPDEVYIIRESGSQDDQITESGSQTNVYTEGG